jgi:outer membrane protein assembly factor BamB
VWLVAWGVLLAAALPCIMAAESEHAAQSPPENDWPQWRGDRGLATVKHPTLPDPWPAGPLRKVWQTKLGAGWSSPVVADGRVFITERSGDSERVLAFDAETGKPLWTRSHEVDFDPHQVGRRHGNGPKATPLVSAGRVYAVGIAGQLDCLRAADGETQWSVNYPKQFGQHERLPAGRARVNGTENVIVPIGDGQGAPVPLFGYTGSPAIAGKLLITPVGGRRGGTIIAFDKDTGQVAWKSLAENVSYSSPIVADIGGVEQVVVMTGPRVVGLAAKDGAFLWSHPFQIQYDESISTPAVAGDLVLVTATGRPLTALRITRSGNKWQARVEWTEGILSSYLSSMVKADGYVYGMNDGGEFSCVRLADGKTLWTGGNHGYYSSPILAGKRLFALNDRGLLAVLAADPAGYKALGESKLATSETWTMPAIVGSRIYVRSADALACFDTR